MANCYWFMVQYGDRSSLKLIGPKRAPQTTAVKRLNRRKTTANLALNQSLLHAGRVAYRRASHISELSVKGKTASLPLIKAVFRRRGSGSESMRVVNFKTLIKFERPDEASERRLRDANHHVGIEVGGDRHCTKIRQIK
ncbi:hypothetical protein CBL_06540 [Carabus blaptoides fortunei]